MQWNTWPPGELRSFANSTRTHEGGAHEQGFRTALTDLVNHYARRQRQISANDEDTSPGPTTRWWTNSWTRTT